MSDAVPLTPLGVGSRDWADDAHQIAELLALPSDLDHLTLSNAGLFELGTEVASRLQDHLAGPETVSTRQRWEILASLAAADLTLARIVEPHLDALDIVGQAVALDPDHHVDLDLPHGLLGVYAAEGPGVRLSAQRAGTDWTLNGVKPWCSLATEVSGFLVTAWVDDHERGLFLVDASCGGLRVPEPAQAWVARGLSAVRSPSVAFDQVPAVPVGDPGWYLQRPGFAWGGLGVAAIWYGATVALARRVYAAALTREPDQIACQHLGALDAALTQARTALAEAAHLIDTGDADGMAAPLALRVRQVVRRCAEEVLWRTDHALGPGPLTTEAAHARRVADLHLYLRQEHAERDQAALGRQLLATTPTESLPW